MTEGITFGQKFFLLSSINPQLFEKFLKPASIVPFLPLLADGGMIRVGNQNHIITQSRIADDTK